MTDTAILGGWLHLPFSVIGGEEERAALRRTLTHASAGFAGYPGKVVRLYDESVPGYLGVPRAWGLRRFANVPMVDQRSDGFPILCPRRPDPNHPRVLEPAKQAQFMADLLARSRIENDFTAKAGTGTGKTTCGLNLAAEEGRTTFIMVHMEMLLDQWCLEIQDKLAVPSDKIGIAQGPRCDYQGKWFVVGILNSIAMRDYDPAFYRYFGRVILDEAHKVGCQFFAPAMPRFYARKRLQLTATPKRKDGSDKVFIFHGGPVSVTSTARTLDCEVRTMPHHAAVTRFSDKRAVLDALMDDRLRNARLAKCIHRFYVLGRVALVISAEIIHLQALMKLAFDLGVPRDAMGLFTGTTQTAKRVTVRGKSRLVRKSTKQDDATLADIKARAQIIFSTYNMMDAGLDIPRLDAGIDATPSADAEQLIGRIRRPMPGKPEPLWITPLDVGIPQCERWFISRCKDYRATGARVVQHGTQAGGIDARTA